MNTAHRMCYRKYYRQCLVVLVTCLSAAPSHADETQPFNGYVALLNNYVGRGLAQSVGEPAFQAEVNYDTGRDGFYTGVSASSINWIDQLYVGSSVSLELDLWAGYRWTFAKDWSLKTGVLHFQFPGYYAPQDPPIAEPHTTEIFATLGWSNISARMNYAVTDAFGTPDSKGSWYLDVSASHSLSENWDIGAHIGRKQGRGIQAETGTRNDAASYTDYKVSVTRQLGNDFSIDLAYTWTNADASLYTLNGYNVAGNRFRVALQKNF